MQVPRLALPRSARSRVARDDNWIKVVSSARLARMAGGPLPSSLLDGAPQLPDFGRCGAPSKQGICGPPSP